MAVKQRKRGAVVAAKTKQSIKVTQKAYGLAMALFNANADKSEVPVTKEIMGVALAELTAKGVAKRIGLTRGRYGKPGSVKLLVQRDQLIPVPNRTSRKANADAKIALFETTDRATPALTIDTLEEFVRAYRREQEPLIAERSRTLASRISELQQHLAVSQGDDFRNTMVMANAALRQLDDVEHEVSAEVIARLKPAPQSPLFPVWSAMRSGSSTALEGRVAES